MHSCSIMSWRSPTIQPVILTMFFNVQGYPCESLIKVVSIRGTLDSCYSTG